MIVSSYSIVLLSGNTSNVARPLNRAWGPLEEFAAQEPKKDLGV